MTSQVRKYANDDANLNVGALIVAQTKKYIDLDANFITNSTTKDLYLKKDASAVKQSIKNLILTHYGERPFQPYIGMNDYLFENVTTEIAILLEKSIRQTIQNFEPRASVEKIHIDLYPSDNSLLITIFFYIINIKELQSIEVNLERIR